MNLEQIQHYLSQLNIVSIFVRLTLAVICGGIIGMERGTKRRPAGLRTHILVCLGSALTMITNQYMYLHFSAPTDPARLGAQVISGIGFLGAGTIIVTGKQQVKGLTTAAGLWASACMGLAVGVGFYSGAILACIFILGVMSVLYKFDEAVTASSKIIELYIEFDKVTSITDFIQYIKDNEWQVLSVELAKAHPIGDTNTGIVILIKTDTKLQHEYIIEMISKQSGILYIEELTG